MLRQKFNYLFRKDFHCNKESNRWLNCKGMELLTTLQTCGNLFPRTFEDGEIKWCCPDVQNRSSVDNYTEASLKQLKHWRIRFPPQNWETFLRKGCCNRFELTITVQLRVLVRSCSRKNFKHTYMCIYSNNDSEEFINCIDYIILLKGKFFQSNYIRNKCKYG